MNIDKWDLFSICESILLVSDKPVSVEQVVEVLMREQEEELERLEEETEAQQDETFAAAAALPNDPAFSTLLRSPMVAAKLERVDEENILTWAAMLGDDVTPDVTPEPVVVEEKTATVNDEARRLAAVKRELANLVQDAFDALVAAYSDEKRTVGRGFIVVQVAEAYQLRTSSLCAPFIRHHLQVKPTKLSRAQLETLAIIAYRQPVTRPELEQIRGVDCGAAMKILLDKRLVRILGKKEEVGRPLLYGTSREFLEFFRLGSLLELPTLREFQELSDEHKRQVEEELEAEAPLGNLRELAASTPAFEHDDSALIQDLDTALSGVKATVNRVAELTGLKQTDE
jgi:segregation and condensation protein B